MITKTSGQQKLNKKDVQKGTFNFIFSFIILCCFSFLAIFLFFKSSEVQKDTIQQDVEHYKTIISRNNILQTKLDTIYFKMSKLSKNQVGNEIFLRNSIVRDIKECQIVMGEDSIKEFKQYASLMNSLKKSIQFKDDMMMTNHEEQIALRDLNECQRKVDQLNKAIDQLTK
ncbi:type VI secretion system TssO [Chishuiella sp.]|uniref:type VI secretion system TssO n=1 Tax=Chishuiella sp. TaxID=1969467 RepID=UPI0028AD6B37|nr:type VI secretion system TssO [Chishuiella sp.]